MAWSETKSAAPVDLSPEYFLKKESNWESAYPGIEGWVEVLRGNHYNLVGEYVIDECRTLYRFELDESYRDEAMVYASHFVNVTISDKSKEPKLATVIETSADKCPTCRKPL